MRVGLLAGNLIAWPLIQISIAWGATRVDGRRFGRDGRIFRVQRWELSLYERYFHVRLWKGMLPDGAEWLHAGFPKRSLRCHSRRYLCEYATETRRGEAAHWAMLAFLPLFFVWDPPWACAVMTAYALATNLPCIIAQRYNRGRIAGMFDNSAI